MKIFDSIMMMFRCSGCAVSTDTEQQILIHYGLSHRGVHKLLEKSGAGHNALTHRYNRHKEVYHGESKADNDQTLNASSFVYHRGLLRVFLCRRVAASIILVMPCYNSLILGYRVRGPAQ